MELEIITDKELIEQLELDSDQTYYQEVGNNESSTIYWYDEIGALHHHTY